MKKFIISLVFVLAVIGSLVYFVFSSDRTLSITYIKFNINPEFIIGVSGNDKVSIYNPLNDDAKVLNLTMFSGMDISDAIKVIMDTLDDKQYINDNEVNITVITKDPKKIDYYYNKVNTVINNMGKEIILTNKRATSDELLAYSNEVVYDNKGTYNNDDLLKIATSIEIDINKYISGKIESLSLGKKNIDEKAVIINKFLEDGYFNDYDLLFYNIADYDLKIMDYSKYSIVFDEKLDYIVTLNLELEQFRIEKKNDVEKNIVESYNYTYSKGTISNLKSTFYKYN